jgi:hypothetical protein
MIFVPRQWCVSVASSMNANCSTTARRIASALSGLKNEEL